MTEQDSSAGYGLDTSGSPHPEGNRAQRVEKAKEYFRLLQTGYCNRAMFVSALENLGLSLVDIGESEASIDQAQKDGHAKKVQALFKSLRRKAFDLREFKIRLAELGHAVTMKAKSGYFANGEIMRGAFQMDLVNAAFSIGVSISSIMTVFFASETFTEREMGSFACNVSAKGSILEGAPVLVRALGITQDQAPSMNILPKYFDFSGGGPHFCEVAWAIDAILDWPLGTIMPSSRWMISLYKARA